MVTKTKIVEPEMEVTPTEIIESQFDMGDLDLSEYDGVMEESSNTPICWVISPPNVEDDQIEELGNKYGVFVSEDEAEKAGFKPNSDWKSHTRTFGKGATASKLTGYLNNSQLRFVIVSQGAKEVQEKGEKGWVYKGLAYGLDGELTEKGKLAKDSDEKAFRLVTRRLVLFLNADNTPMSDLPFSMLCRGGLNGCFSADLATLHGGKDQTGYFNVAYQEATNKKNAKFPYELRSFQVFSGKLGYLRNDGTSPFLAFKGLDVPTVNKELVGTTKTLARQNYDVNLTFVPMSKMLIQSKNYPETHRKITELKESYSEFSKPRKVQSERPVKLVGYFVWDSLQYSQDLISCNFNSDKKVYSVIIPSELEAVIDSSAMFEIGGKLNPTRNIITMSSCNEVQTTTDLTSFETTSEEVDYDEIPF
jgi:hypothetical protein